jgi:uracil-DNA glycosylase family 4
MANIKNFEKPFSWIGKSEIKIVMVGHSPYVRSSQKAEYVLKIDRQKQGLYKYITGEILEPLGININNVYFTNLLKCLTDNPPENIRPKAVFDEMLNNCKDLFEKEILIIRPKIIISLSECVLKFISKKYYKEELSMQRSFGEMFDIRISDNDYKFIPVNHILRKNSQAWKFYLPKQTDKLKELSKILQKE